MGDNRRFYLKLVKATRITIVMLGHHGRGTMDMLRGTMDMSMVPQYWHRCPWCPFVKEYIFLNFIIPKISFLQLNNNKNVLIDTGKYCIPVRHHLDSPGLPIGR